MDYPALIRRVSLPLQRDSVIFAALFTKAGNGLSQHWRMPTTPCALNLPRRVLTTNPPTDSNIFWKDLIEAGRRGARQSKKITPIFPRASIVFASETLGYEQAKKVLAEAAPQSSQDIIQRFVQAGEAWAADSPQNDDVTFVVVKVRHSIAAC